MASSSVDGAEDKDESPEDDISILARRVDVGYGKFTGAKGMVGCLDSGELGASARSAAPLLVYHLGWVDKASQ